MKPARAIAVAAAVLAASLSVVAATAQAQIYRCEANGSVTYADSPCTGAAVKQTVVNVDPGAPDDADKAAAARRQKQDKTAADKLELERVKREKADADAQRRLLAEQNRSRSMCANLQRRIQQGQIQYDHSIGDSADAVAQQVALMQQQYQRSCAGTP